MAQTQEETKTKLNALYDLSLQMFRFGPVLAAKMSYYSTIYLPWGIGAAGAESVKQGVDNDDATGVATLTASMVRLGLLGTVHDIVVSLCAQDRADAVAKVTAELLTQQEVVVVVQITNSLVASGHVADAVSIGNELISHGNTQIYEALKDSDFDLGLLAQSSTQGVQESASNMLQSVSEQGGKLAETVKQQGTELLNSITPQGEEQGNGDASRLDEEEKARAAELEQKHGQGVPDADKLFGDWSGHK